MGFPGGSVVKNLPAKAEDTRHRGVDPWAKAVPWRRKWQPSLVFLPENPMDRAAWQTTVHGVVKESDTTEHTHAECCCCC